MMPPMPTITRPLDSRARRVAYLDLAGWKADQICQELGISRSKLRSVQKSPLYRALLSELHRKTADATVAQVVAKIEGEAMNSVDTLIALRDDGETEASVRRGCANDLLDRMPELRRVKTPQDDTKGLQIHFDQPLLSRIFQVLAEDAGTDPSNVKRLLEAPDGSFVLEGEHEEDEELPDEPFGLPPMPLDCLIDELELYERCPF